ncbi:MAG: hypothetical protein ACKVQS_03845 [Fimbriimonadaceae bacterium]
MSFDIERAESERMKSLGAENPVWLRYLRIRDWVLKMGEFMGFEGDTAVWKTFVLLVDAFPGDPEPADLELEAEAKEFVRKSMEKGNPGLLDAHEAILFMEEIMEQEQIPADEAIDRMGNIKILPFTDEVLAALIAVVPQPKPDLSAIPEDVLGENES